MRYTAIENRTGKQIEIEAYDDNSAMFKISGMTAERDITITNTNKGESFPLAIEILSDSAYIGHSRLMGESISYILYILADYDGKIPVYSPIIGVDKSRIDETFCDEHFVTHDKSTHKIGGWYVGFPKSDIEGHEFAFIDYCENHGKIKFERL